MATVVLHPDLQALPPGTTVGAYPASNYAPPAVAYSSGAVGSATTTSAVQTDGTLTFTGLADGTRYVAGASVSSVWRWFLFSTPAVTSLADLQVSSRYLSDLARTRGGLPTGAIAQTMQITQVDTTAAAFAASGTSRMQRGIVLPGGRPVTSITFVSQSTAATTPTNIWFFLTDLSRVVLATTLNNSGGGTGDTTNGQPTVSNLSAASGWHQGDGITGTGIPAGTTVLSVSGTTLTLSANATATNAGVTLSPAWAASTARTLLIASAIAGNTAGPYTPSVETEVYVGINVTAAATPTLAGHTATATINGLAPVFSGNSTAALTDPASAPGTMGAVTAAGTQLYAYVS